MLRLPGGQDTMGGLAEVWLGWHAAVAQAEARQAALTGRPPRPAALAESGGRPRAYHPVGAHGRRAPERRDHGPAQGNGAAEGRARERRQPGSCGLVGLARVAELSRGFGLGGRARREGSASERARVSVTRAIKYAIRKLREHDATLAEILARDVKTGTYCTYAPVDRDRIAWTL